VLRVDDPFAPLAEKIRAKLREAGPASPKSALPVITFAESLSVHFNGEEVKGLHFPDGHTDGDRFVGFTGSGMIHLGNEFFMGDKGPRFPFVDASSGGDVQQLAKNISKVIGILPSDIKIISGHRIACA